MEALTQENKKQSDMLARVVVAVCGDNQMGLIGFTDEVNSLKKWKRAVEKQLAYVMGAVAASWFFICLLAYLCFEWVKLKLGSKE